jgi:hypothetical protein
MLCCVDLERTNVSEEHVASMIRKTRIGVLGTLAETSNQRTLHAVFLLSVLPLLVTANIVPTSSVPVTLMEEAIRSSEKSVLTRATCRNIPEEGIFQCIPLLCNFCFADETQQLHS